MRTFPPIRPRHPSQSIVGSRRSVFGFRAAHARRARAQPALRAGQRDRARRHGRRLSGERSAPQAHGRHQGPAARARVPQRDQDALPARGGDRGAAEPSEHRRHLRRRRGRRHRLLRDGVHHGRQPRQARCTTTARCRSTRRAARCATWPTRSPTPTSAASSTATSSPTTS